MVKYENCLQCSIWLILCGWERWATVLRLIDVADLGFGIRVRPLWKKNLLFFVQKSLQLLWLVVLLQPILVRLQHLARSQGAKRRIHHSKICPSPKSEKGIFFAHRLTRIICKLINKYSSIWRHHQKGFRFSLRVRPRQDRSVSQRVVASYQHSLKKLTQ